MYSFSVPTPASDFELDPGAEYRCHASPSHHLRELFHRRIRPFLLSGTRNRQSSSLHHRHRMNPDLSFSYAIVGPPAREIVSSPNSCEYEIVTLYTFLRNVSIFSDGVSILTLFDLT